MQVGYLPNVTESNILWQDVSDRVEKEDVTGSVLERLETGANTVCEAGDWRAAVDAEVTADLRKYRSYRGDSVRDLLRALRNKVDNDRVVDQNNCLFMDGST